MEHSPFPSAHLIDSLDTRQQTNGPSNSLRACRLWSNSDWSGFGDIRRARGDQAWAGRGDSRSAETDRNVDLTLPNRKFLRARYVVEGIRRHRVVVSVGSAIITSVYVPDQPKSIAYASTVKSMQFASPYPKLLHWASALQAALQVAKVFLVPEESK